MAELEPIEGGAPNPPPPGPAKPAPAARTQKFRAVHNVWASSGTAEPGELVALTREEFDLLKPQGSIEGEWKEK